MLNGPTYEELVKHFFVRASIYDFEAAKLEETEKILIDPSLEGKTREEMSLKEFTRTEIHSSVLGILVTISKEVIARAIGCPNEGNFQWNLNAKTSSWLETTRNLLHKDTPTLVYKNMSPELKILQKLIQETFLLKGGGTDQLSLDHKVFLYHLVKLEKVNMPKYTFNHMFWALRESQHIRRRFIPYGRLISEIFHQGKLLQVLKTVGVVADSQLGTMTRKIMNGRT